MSYILAIDAGTTGVRAVVFDAGGCTLGTAYHEFRISFPRPGWAEQDPKAVWQGTAEVVAGAIREAGIRPDGFLAVGVANQRSSVVAWDATDLCPLSAMITWQDMRTVERCRELEDRGFFVSPNLAVTKAEWLLRNVPGVQAAANAGRLRIGTPDSWLVAKLTGGLHVTDHSNASATGFYSHLTRSWDAQVLDAVGIAAEWMPEIVDSSGVLDRIGTDVVGVEVPVASICGDQQASLYGLGCLKSGDAKCSYGTAAMVDSNSAGDLAIGGKGTYPLVAWSIEGETTYCIEGTVVTSGAAVQWLRDGLGIIAEAAEADTLARSVPDTGGVWVVPAFQGLGTPWVSNEARAAIGGLSRGSTKAHVTRAVLEGIAQRVADVAETVWQGRQAPPVLRADGGASRNDFLMQRQADLLGLPVERSAESDGAALGAALLAARAVGGVWDDAEGTTWRFGRTFEPDITADERDQSRSRWRQRIERLIESGAL